MTPEEKKEIQNEIVQLNEFARLARSIIKNSKGEALLQALKSGFTSLAEKGASRKAIVFTESVRHKITFSAYLNDQITKVSSFYSMEQIATLSLTRFINPGTTNIGEQIKLPDQKPPISGLRS